ncbi:uncharacterized protein LOC133822162 [Humulus lupulus]|uniref:uncharacterized protein LOC133822162 n=1 Tax=Humulus lupulus TaxID=3486 RepID=UPI002B408408|nr:uncharacterized protein LOC133822162 [Humulus lupulus]
MAKRKKSIRRPEILSDDRSEKVSPVAQTKALLGSEGDDVAEPKHVNLMDFKIPGSGVMQDGDMDRQGKSAQPVEVVDDGLGSDLRNVSWADRSEGGDKVTEGDFQSESQLQSKGQKLVQVDIEEVKIQSANWSSTVVCMVLGANPPMAVFEGFIKRVWGHLGIAQISRMTLGLTLVKFNDEATRDHVLENGVLQFDRKPVIIRPWTADLSAIRSTPLWIRLHDLGLQYWGSKCISALVSTIGKPLLVDKFTRERSRVQFARVLVEMEITNNPPRSFQFINEHGQIVEQGIEYEWVPTKCKSCSGFGHSMADCRKEHKTIWVEKEARSKVEIPLEQLKVYEGLNEGEPGEKAGGSKVVENSDPSTSDVTLSGEANSGPVKERNREAKWQTPRHVATQSRQGLTASGNSNLVVEIQKQNNQFVVLQEQEKGSKIGHLGVQDVFRKNKIGISGLLETKLRGNKIGEFMENKFPNWEFYSSPVTEGRLLIVWRKGIAKLIILEESPQLVHCQVNLVGHMSLFHVTFVYGYNSVENRRSLWNDLTRISFSIKAWIVLGDFNAPFSGGDRSGGNPIASIELADSIGWLTNAKIEALKSMGSYFTWTNNQDGSARIYSKIDHVLINEEWLDMFPQSLAMFQWEVVSDHCSCVVSNIPMEAMGIKLLVRLKHRLKKFNRDCIGDVGSGYRSTLVAFQDAQYQAQENPQDLKLQVVVKERASEFHQQEQMYHSFLAQRSKINWVRKGDMNSSFFHAYLKKRKAENTIVSYINDHGMLVDDFKEVVDHFVDHFKNHLGSTSPATGTVDLHCIALGTKLSVEQQLSLLKPFSNKEIRAALFSIPNTKLPGPDGYGLGFFKFLWKDIGQDICSAIIHGFSTGQFPKELHETTFSLIPKVSNPARASDYRTIACCSTLYKVMAKLLCSRLAVVLPSLIQSNQGAFVRGRSIAHNIMIFQDLIKNYGRDITSPRCAIKIDLSKAYDIVDWHFLENLLKAYCFPMKFIGWVMNCIRNTTYSLLINGRVQSSFKGEKGLRQGDPMSPLLFVLIMEYMTRSLQLAARSPLFRFHPMCKSLKLVNLCFADDIILFCKGSLATVSVLKDTLGKFSEASGLSINAKKSHIYFGGVSAADRREITQVIQLPEDNFPLHYLGVPMRPTKWKHVDCEIIVHKMRTKLFLWSSKHLSYAGRLLLIHIVLFGLRNYWMNVFILPQSIIKEVDKLCRLFLWGASVTRSKLHLASWQQVCLPKAYGGLGHRDGASWNRALLAKYVWAVTTKQDTLRVKWVQHVYLKGVNFWNYVLKQDSSWYWWKICHLGNRFNEGEVIAAGFSGKFKSSKLYNSSLNQQLVAYKNVVWCQTILPKHRFLLWMVVNSYLLTRDNLAKSNILLNSSYCPVCEDQLESHHHFLFECCLSKRVFSCIFSWLGFQAWATKYLDWTVRLSVGKNDSLSIILNMVLAAVVYHIWRNRNRCIFDGFSLTANCIAKEVITLVQYRLYIVHSRKVFPYLKLFLRKLQCM